MEIQESIETGQYYRTLRLIHNVSQEAISETLGVPVTMINNFEEGQSIPCTKLLETSIRMLLAVNFLSTYVFPTVNMDWIFQQGEEKSNIEDEPIYRMNEILLSCKKSKA